VKAYPPFTASFKNHYDKKEIFLFGSLYPGCHRRIRTGRVGRYQRSHKHGNLVFRACNQAHLCDWCGCRADRRRESIQQIQFRRPRYKQDCGFMVRRMYLPDCGGNHSSFLLFVDGHGRLSN